MTDIISTSVIPVAAIPAAALLSLTFNNRLQPLLHSLRQNQHKRMELKHALHIKKTDLEKVHYASLREGAIGYQKRIHFLRWAIGFQYTAILFFSVAALFISMGFIHPVFVEATPYALIGGTVSLFIGGFIALFELKTAITFMKKKEKFVEDLSFGKNSK